MKAQKAMVIGLFLLLAFSVAYATNFDFVGGTKTTFVAPDGTDTNISFTPSTNVTITCVTTSNTYLAIGKHLNGNRVFGVASDQSQIYYLEDTTAYPGKDISGSGVTVPSASDTFLTAWKSL